MAKVFRGAAGSPAEMGESRDRLAAWFLRQTAEPPFSFIYGGQPSAEVLASWKVERSTKPIDEGRIAHTVVYADPVSGLEIRCEAIEYTFYPALDWLLRLHNTGAQDTPILERIKPLDVCLTGTGASFVLHYALGDTNSAESFAPREQRLVPTDATPFVIGATRGRSSEGHMPYFNLAGEGGGQAVAVGWSGQWEASFQQVGDNRLNVVAGMQLTHLKLHPGEAIRTPRILIMFWKGEEPLRGNNLYRQVALDYYLPRRNGELVMPPISASTREVDPDGTYEGPHMRPMAILAERGIEAFWSDLSPQHWYPIGFPEGTGTWEPDPAKFPRGLKPVGDAIHAAGLKLNLWFEPERVEPGTRVATEHPEWVTGQRRGLFKLHIPEARRWLTDYIDVQITAANLDWLRWDFNTTPLERWRQQDEPDRQGMTEIGHIEGLYAVWDDLRARHSGLVIDNCAAGGRRLDLEASMRGLPLWHSDFQCGFQYPSGEQRQNGALFRWIPLHGCGNGGYEPSYRFRSAMTPGNILTAPNDQGHISTADQDTEEAVKRTVAIYKKLRPYMLGDFYPLFSHNTGGEDVWYGYQFHRADLDAGYAMLYRLEVCTVAVMPVRMRAIDPEARYEISYEDTPETSVESGDALSAFPVKIATASSSAILYYRKIQGGKTG